MSAEPVYVHIAKFAVKSIFDGKLKAKLPELMQKTATKVVEKSRILTTKPPRDKRAPGFYVDGAVDKIETNERSGKTYLSGEMVMQLATWPEKKMFAFPTAKTKFEVEKPDKMQGEVDLLVLSLVKDLMEKQVIKELEKRAKAL